MSSRTCHRDLKARAKFFGLDAEVSFGACLSFFIATRLGASTLAAALTAVTAAWAIDYVRRGRLRGVLGALRDFLRWPSFHTVLGDDTIPRFPKDVF
jgi:hypothetical protein